MLKCHWLHFMTIPRSESMYRALEVFLAYRNMGLFKMTLNH